MYGTSICSSNTPGPDSAVRHTRMDIRRFSPLSNRLMMKRMLVPKILVDIFY
jgi:hypothetical protein